MVFFPGRIAPVFPQIVLVGVGCGRTGIEAGVVGAGVVIVPRVEAVAIRID
jgi:hypothetical protein